MKFLMQEIKLTEKELKELQNVISMLENIIIFMERKETKELVIDRETIKGTIFSTDSEFSFDLNSLKYNWKSKTFFSLPRRFAKGTQTLNVEASGNNIDINVKKLQSI